MRPLRSELSKIYGPIINGTWPQAKDFLTIYTLPQDFNLTFNGKSVRHISLNKDMLDPFTLAMNNVKNRGLASYLKTFDGCWMIRNTRGMNIQSVHSWGLACDFDSETNKLGTAGNMNLQIVNCFELAGFIWGGDFSRKDPMHFQYVTEDI